MSLKRGEVKLFDNTENKPKKKTSGIFKMELLVGILFFIGFMCVLIFWVQIFETYKKALVVSVNSTGWGSKYLEITFLVDGVEYTGTTPKGGFTNKYVYYKPENPTEIWNDSRPFLMGLLLFGEAIIIGMIAGFCVREAKRKKE